MVFAVSEGKLRPLQKPSYQAPTALALSDDYSEDYAAIYRKQPAVRTVVDFLARNFAQLSLHTFRRVGETDRERLRDHAIARLFAKPNAYTTPYRLFHALMSDTGIYDRALWLKATEKDGSLALYRVPPRLWTVADGDSWLKPTAFVVKGNRGEATIAAENAVYFRGYNPEDERYGLSKIESLRRALAEEHAAGIMREQTLRNGARVNGYITRPASNKDWSKEARERFATGWRQQYAGLSATEAGGTPVLEDGMKFEASAHSAVDLQYVESRKLTREEVASAYFIPPPMIGILDNASFSNITEQHKMLYQDTLGPLLQEIKQEIELQVLPDFEDVGDVYVEFNLAEKLRGSFEEQAAQLQTSVGAPYMTRNEARARANLPAIEGGDELVVPLNVLIGGQASPTDSAPAQLSWRPPLKALAAPVAPVAVKAKPSEGQVAKAQQMLSKFFARQGAVVRSAIGAGSDEWWNEKRWDDELAADLYALSVAVTSDVAKRALERLGEDPSAYDVDRTLRWLATVAADNASSINAATRIQVEEALEADEPAEAVAHVFEIAESSRAEQAAGTVATTLAAFATAESAQQVAGTRTVTKTWVVTSGNPRPSHAAMNGETVGIDDVFSNGARWPGDSGALDVDDIAGCTCDIQVQIET